MDYTDSFKSPAHSFNDIGVSKVTKEKGLCAGYVDIVDYAVTSEPGNTKSKAEFLETKKDSASTRPQNQTCGYVDVTEYHDTSTF